MGRLIWLLFFFPMACLLAGIYGAVHNQVSYTISSEYFTKFKFIQFQIDSQLPDRLGAACVGWQASWWMGIVIGVFVIPFGLIIRGTWGYVHGVLRSFILVFLTTLVFGIVGLAISYLTIASPNSNTLVVQGQIISDPEAFRRAGMMHNCSYLGGLIGIFFGMASILRSFLRTETGSEKIW